MPKNNTPSLEILEEELKKYHYGSHPKELYEPIEYIMNLGGKRLRPFMTLVSCYLFDDDFSKAINPAMAIEVFHNFSLVHDDIMDNAPLRRGQPTVHEKWNPNTAILSGDVMLVEAYNLLLDIEDNEVLRKCISLFNQTAKEVCEGQQLDMNFENLAQVSLSEYLNMIRLKTSVLLGCSLKMGALIGGANNTESDSLYDFGVKLGLSFQIMDDVLDAFGDEAIFGKKKGGDILCNKKTFLTSWVLENAADEYKSVLKQRLSNSDQGQDKIDAVLEIYTDSGAKIAAHESMDTFYSDALLSLDRLNIPDTKKALLVNFAAKLMEREF